MKYIVKIIVEKRCAYHEQYRCCDSSFEGTSVSDSDISSMRIMRVSLSKRDVRLSVRGKGG
jgi:hypothetical protein